VGFKDRRRSERWTERSGSGGVEELRLSAHVKSYIAGGRVALTTSRCHVIRLLRVMLCASPSESNKWRGWGRCSTSMLLGGVWRGVEGEYPIQ
jgi:hypothetical protein